MTKTVFIKILVMNYLERYLRGNRLIKKQILDELELQTGYHRKSLIRSFKIQQLDIQGTRGGSVSKYHPLTQALLELVWEANDYVCAERMHSELSNTVDELLRNDYLVDFNTEVMNQVKNMPLGTLKLKLRQLPRPVGLTVRHKSGKTDLRRIIPINTKQGKALVAGHLEIDFVDHNGGDCSGRFARTFSMEDVKTQWHLKYAVLGRDGTGTRRAYDYTESKMPFSIKSVHSDNEPSLLATTLEKHLRDKSVFISRSRPYQKQDNGHVEQKNGDKIRGLVGYRRYDTEEQVDLLNKIYEIDDLIQNYFIPSMRLQDKIYDDRGKLIKKVYDKAQTPYTRVMKEKSVKLIDKQRLTREKQKYDRLSLIRERNKLLLKLRSVR